MNSNQVKYTESFGFPLWPNNSYLYSSYKQFTTLGGAFLE